MFLGVSKKRAAFVYIGALFDFLTKTHKINLWYIKIMNSI